MVTAEELLASMQETEGVLTIDSDLRTIAVPSGFEILGVESDDDVNRVEFKGPRYYHGIDLSQFNIRVNINNARGEADLFPVTDVTADDDTLSFSWLIGRFTAQYYGTVTFSLCFREIDSQGVVIREFNTTTATGTILEGLETGELIIQRHPDIIEGILLRLESLEETGLPESSNMSQTVFATIPKGLSMGDVTGDGVINYTDVNIIVGYVSNEGVSDVDASKIKIDPELALAMADVNANGGVDEDDAMAIVAYIENADPTVYYASARDYYGNWNWDSVNNYYYYDIPVNGMTVSHSAVLTLSKQIDSASYIGASCMRNAVRVCVKACPVEPIECAVTYSAGNGTVFVANTNSGSGYTNGNIRVKEYESIADVMSMDFSEFKAGDIVLAYQKTTAVEALAST